MTARRWLWVALVVGGWARAAAPATVLYVSPTGDDGNAGTRAAPKATPVGARDAIRALKRSAG